MSVIVDDQDPSIRFGAGLVPTTGRRAYSLHRIGPSISQSEQKRPSHLGARRLPSVGEGSTASYAFEGTNSYFAGVNPEFD
jgi:hypothetical protein